MKPPTRINILIDYRESNEKLLHAIRNYPGFKVEFGHLVTGDFRIDDLLLIERKTGYDFGLSVVQGRLFRQAYRLCRAVHDRNVESSVLIVEGKEDEFQKIDISREAIFGAMVSLQVRFHLPVFRTQSPVETVKMMKILYHQICVEDNHSGRTFPQRWGKFSRQSRLKNQIFLLQGLPGVGSSRGADLLDHFGSIEAIFTASGAELCNVKGEGKATAQDIRKLIEK